MRVLRGQDLMQGSDHEFIINLYRCILLRGPDETGYRHHRDVIEADPGCRRSLVEGFAASSEARRQGEAVHIIWDDAEMPTATPSATAPEALLEALRQRLGSLDDASLAALEASLVECLEALRAVRRKSPEPGA
jgi:hypothetical protein